VFHFSLARGEQAEIDKVKAALDAFNAALSSLEISKMESPGD